MWRATARQLTEDPLLVRLCSLLARPSPRCLRKGAVRPPIEVYTRRSIITPTIIKPTLYGDPLHNYNTRLSKNLDRGKLDRIFRVCREMLDANIKPDLTTYNIVLQTFGRLGMTDHTEDLFKEMKANGIEPNVESYTALVQAYAMARDVPKSLELLDSIKELGMTPLPLTYQRIIEGTAMLNEIEWGVELLEHFLQEGVQITQASFIELIKAAIWSDEPEIALKLLLQASTGLRSLPAGIHLDVLRLCSNHHKSEETRICWDMAVNKQQCVPDEGLCIDVLMCAGVFGQPDLAREVLRLLARKRIKYADYHLAPLMEAFAVQGSFKGAFNVITTMRNASIAPTINLAYPLVRKASESIEQLDKAWRTLEGIKVANKTIDVIAIQVMLRSCQKLQDLGRAMMFHKTSIAWGIEPVLDNYKILLSLCVDLRARPMGDQLLVEMTERGMAWDTSIYTTAVALSLTQSNYEDAFKYLEQLKSEDIVPPESIYRLIVRKCARERDSRAYLAMEEMETLGYRVSNELRRYVETAGDEEGDLSPLGRDQSLADEAIRSHARAQEGKSLYKRRAWLDDAEHKGNSSNVSKIPKILDSLFHPKLVGESEYQVEGRRSKELDHVEADLSSAESADYTEMVEDLERPRPAHSEDDDERKHAHMV